MNREIAIKQKSIYMCDLSIDSIENEQQGLHPVLIASTNIRNNTSNNIFIFPITHADKKEQPTHYQLLKENYNFFNYDINTVICEEGRSISKKRLVHYIGKIEKEDFDKILICKEFIFLRKKC